jgi:hypothetical protein
MRDCKGSAISLSVCLDTELTLAESVDLDQLVATWICRKSIQRPEHSNELGAAHGQSLSGREAGDGS